MPSRLPMYALANGVRTSSSAWRGTGLAGLALVAACMTPAPGHTFTIIHGTGEGSSPGGRDANWDIVALPSPLATGVTLDTPPYQAYVLTDGRGAWIGGGTTPGAGSVSPQQGINFNGVMNYWVAPRNSTDAIVGGATPSDPNTWYHWILRQDFNVARSDYYNFNFKGTGDNALEFYINGSIDTSVALRPTITGGDKMTVTGPQTLSTLSTYSGTVYLNAGVHSAYMVLVDRGAATGAIIQQSTFDVSPPVPAPLPLFGAAAAFGASRKLRARIRLGRAGASDQLS